MRLLQALGLIAFLAAGAATGAIAGAAQAASLAGKVLVAHEGMPDPRFEETVIYLVNHDETGAFGLVVNKPRAAGPIATLLDQLGIDAGEYGDGVQGSVILHYGGPVEPERGFVLHSADYDVDGTRQLTRGVALTDSPEVLVDIGLGRGPRRSLVIFGYSGWGPLQLEGELARGDWKVVDADADLVLGTDHEDKWRRALEGLMII
ncbi:MAG: YqgE/AlgH family protein [Rhodospirillales bacterium]|nr:YqgE/AlgH family protein [Rhodospirillales bacterium]